MCLGVAKLAEGTKAGPDSRSALHPWKHNSHPIGVGTKGELFRKKNTGRLEGTLELPPVGLARRRGVLRNNVAVEQWKTLWKPAGDDWEISDVTVSSCS
jgi:hypothetical protein